VPWSRLPFIEAFDRGIGGAIPSNRIVVVGNHPELMDAIADLVIGEPGLQLVAAASDTTQAIALSRLHQPDVLLVDLEAIDINAAEIAREVNLHSPSTRMIALSSYHDTADVQRTLDAGFHRKVSKISGIADLVMILLEDHVCVS
jgi:DNA-binding NarL/FixJ family response regulator